MVLRLLFLPGCIRNSHAISRRWCASLFDWSHAKHWRFRGSGLEIEWERSGLWLELDVGCEWQCARKVRIGSDGTWRNNNGAKRRRKCHDRNANLGSRSNWFQHWINRGCRLRFAWIPGRLRHGEMGEGERMHYKFLHRSSSLLCRLCRRLHWWSFCFWLLRVQHRGCSQRMHCSQWTAINFAYDKTERWYTWRFLHYWVWWRMSARIGDYGRESVWDGRISSWSWP